MDYRDMEEALKKVSIFGEGMLKSKALDEMVYLSLVDLLVRGVMIYDPDEDTFVLRGSEDEPCHEV
ncbi:MAG: hypothetical protein J7K08_01125 [Thermoplasmata archaeon]|nr:hypothetical protein [Thermoplasmata archaeon]OYT50258.1 MAG: hypothetical protein B6U83_00605 [Thermoplasmatales archaeon ex4484_36]HDD59412.1 hypothetical protein [Euryarchaeota archaeon]RLF56115.1 MAG: hypothetical protein DRN28_01465 [Thermoplasmata archaeon]RLF71138.1 MAG: hypothetical protein DRN35_02975 [Thermoplasmata archaeon]